MASSPVQSAIDAAFRDEWGRIVATLIRRTGDWDLAEECAQEAFTEALRHWSHDGIPARPGAWLTTVAANRATDRLRRERRGAELLQQAGRDPSGPPAVHEDTMEDLFSQTAEIPDDRLRLMFTCCHPALPLEGRVALTLRTLAGLTTTEIASAFLVPEATMAKRLTRAKTKIAVAGIPYRVPPGHLLPERTGGVLAVLYLMFNEGYGSSGEQLIRVPLCDEAIRLGRSLQQLMPDEPEVSGLLALMLLQHSRRHARLDAMGELVTLEHQDRTRWHAPEISEALALLDAALRRRRPGPYQLQAAIAACHARAPSAGETDWSQISGLYALLEAQTPSPVVRLNRAVAVAMEGDIEAGLALIDQLASTGTLSNYYLLNATRADLLRRQGDTGAAAQAYETALGLAPSAVERRYLSRRLAELR